MVCIGSINTVLGRPAIANYATLYPDMFQVVWQHRGGISGYTPKNIRLGNGTLFGLSPSSQGSADIHLASSVVLGEWLLWARFSAPLSLVLFCVPSERACFFLQLV